MMLRWVRASSAVLLTLGLALSASVGSVPQQVAGAASVDPLEEETPGQISGTVYSSTGAALEGVVVKAQSGDRAYTDSQGHYVFTNVRPGDHRIHFYGGDVDHETLRLDGTPHFDGVTSQDTDTNVIVTPGLTTSGVDAVLQPSGSIRGTVAEFGEPYGVSLMIDLYRQMGPSNAWARVMTRAIDMAGPYAVTGLAPGDYKVGFSLAREDIDLGDDEPGFVYAGGTTDFTSSPVLHVRVGGTVSNVDVAPDLDGRIEGVVLHPGGQPFHTRVVLRQWDSALSEWAFVDTTESQEDGTFEFGGLPATGFQLTFSPHSEWYPRQDLPGGGTVADAGPTHVVMTMRDHGSIRGTVTDAVTGEPIPGVRVDAMVPEGPCPGWVDSLFWGDTTDASGRFEFKGLSGVRLRFVAPRGYATEYNGDASTAEAAGTISRSPFDDVEVDAALGSGGAIEGVLTDEVGAPRAGVVVTALRRVHGADSSCWQQEDRVQADESGVFRFPGVPPGEYVLEYRKEGLGTRYSGDRLGSAAATRMAVVDRETTSWDEVLTSRVGSISVRIEAESPTSHTPSFRIYLYEEVDGAWRRADPVDTWYVDRSAVPEGRYRVEVEDFSNYPPYRSEFWEDAATVDAARDAVVGAGQTTEIVMRVAPDPLFPIWNATDPDVHGHSQVGQTLSATTGTWNRADLTFSYRWYDTDADAFIDGATEATFTLTAAQLGKTIEAVVTASGPGSNPRSARSDGVGPIGAAPRAPFANTQAPAISGTPEVGTALTASPGAWYPGGARFGYQWLADGTPIIGANADIFVPRAAHLDTRISVRVLAWGEAGSPSTSTSASTGQVRPAPPSTTAPPPATAPDDIALASTGRPVIVGMPRVGRRLRIRGGTWSLDDVTLSYRWFADGKRIRRATRPTLRITARLRGTRIVARVTARTADQAPVTVRTRRTEIIKP